MKVGVQDNFSFDPCTPTHGVQKPRFSHTLTKLHPSKSQDQFEISECSSNEWEEHLNDKGDFMEPLKADGEVYYQFNQHTSLKI